ncbi:MAG: class I SAM-dependent methyltransferase [Alphaproteobacteria bacterium]|nr:class I SAM-dependent methyltransferase [Alphaproteobacteria bacterium]
MYSEKFKIFIDMWREEFAIERSIDEKICLDKDGNPIPWYTYPAIEYLSQFDYSGKQILEFGCGYSSLFWAKRAYKVTSIEDNLKWFDKWKKEFNEPNLDIRWRDEGEIYEQAAFENDIKYDVIIVDGKRRFQCAEAAVKALNKGGMIILDDSDRINTSQEYVKAVDILKKADLLQVDFYGFCPMNNYTKTTSVFFSRDFNFESLYKVQPINGWGNLWSKSRKDRKEFYKKSM